MAEVTLTNNNFKALALESQIPVLVDFWASWCGPCRMLSPVVEEIAREYDGKILVGKVNVDEEAELANAFRIVSIPTLAVIRNGKVETVSVGYKSKREVLSLLGLE